MLADLSIRLRSNLIVKHGQHYRLTANFDHLSEHGWGWLYFSVILITGNNITNG